MLVCEYHTLDPSSVFPQIQKHIFFFLTDRVACGSLAAEVTNVENGTGP